MVEKIEHKDLSHLTKEQVASLIERYYAGEPLKKLLKEFDLQVPYNKIVTLFPREKTDKACEKCGTLMMTKYVGRSDKTNLDHIAYFCPACGHEPGSSYCYCHACEEEREAARKAMREKLEAERKAEEEREKAIAEEKRKAIQETYGGKVERVEYTTLPLFLRVALGALCLALYDPNEQCLKPYGSEDSTLLYNLDKVYEVIGELYDAGTIRVSPTSDIDSFKEENFPNTFFISKVKYRLNFNVNGEECSFSKMFEVATGQGKPFLLKESEKAEVVSLWESLLIQDCMRYMILQFNIIHFNINPTPKMEAYIREILQDFSVRETYYLIYTAIKSASRIYLEGGITKNHAINIAVKTCKTYADRAKLQQWKITPYNRPKDILPDDFFSFFFNQVVKVGEEAVCNLPGFGFGKDHTIDDLNLFTADTEEHSETRKPELE